MWQIALCRVLHCLRHEAQRLGVARPDRRREVPGLLESDVWRQRRHVRIGDRLDYRRTIGREGLLPGVTDGIRSIYANPLQAEFVRISGIGKIRDALGSGESRIAGESP